MVMQKINVHRNLSFPPPLFAENQLLIAPQELQKFGTESRVHDYTYRDGPEHSFRFSTQFLRRMVLFSTIRTLKYRKISFSSTLG